jgi:O-antigen/teichoic acid export membrane protein
MSGEAITGWYSAAIRPVEALQIGHIALLGALFPLMARANVGGSGDKQNWSRLIRASWWLLLSIGALAATALFLLAPPLVGLLYGESFAPAIPALRMLAWTLVPFSINIYLSTDLLSAGKERKVALAFLASLLTLAGLNFLWIPRWGLFGACLATLIAETVQAAGLFLSRKEFKGKF